MIEELDSGTKGNIHACIQEINRELSNTKSNTKVIIKCAKDIIAEIGDE